MPLGWPTPAHAPAVEPAGGQLTGQPFFDLDVPQSYVSCRQDLSMPPEYAFYPRSRRHLGRRELVEIDGCHEACFTRPVDLANAIVEASAD